MGTCTQILLRQTDDRIMLLAKNEGAAYPSRDRRNQSDLHSHPSNTFAKQCLHDVPSRYP